MAQSGVNGLVMCTAREICHVVEAASWQPRLERFDLPHHLSDLFTAQLGMWVRQKGQMNALIAYTTTTAELRAQRRPRKTQMPKTTRTHVTLRGESHLKWAI